MLGKVMFQEIFALSDDPFRVVSEFKGVDANLLSNLQKRPLLIHRDARLTDLFCDKAGPFGTHIKNFSTHLMLSGYSATAPSVGHTHYIAIIAGGRGTGKTTLASYLIHELETIAEKAGAGWNLHSDVSMDEADTAEEFKLKLDKLEHEIEHEMGKGDHCCVLIDDVKESSLPDVLALHGRFELTRFVWFFITTNDLNLINQDFRNTRYHIHKYAMSGLDPDQAVSFLTSRIVQFRDPQLPILQNGFLLHPYDAENVRSAVQKLERSNGDPTPITLRQFATHLSEHLRAKFLSIMQARPDFKIQGSGSKDLVDHQIDLTDAGAIL